MLALYVKWIVEASDNNKWTIKTIKEIIENTRVSILGRLREKERRNFENLAI
jgi:hypothetical protein